MHSGVPACVDSQLGADSAEHLVGPAPTFFKRPGSVDDEVGDGDLLGKGFLRADASEGVLLRSRVARANARQLDFFRACDHDERPKLILRAALDDERRLVASYRFAGPGELVGPLDHSPVDLWMGDRLKRTSCTCVCEDDGSERRPIQRAVWPEDTLAESECDLAKTLAAGRHDLACELVRVYYGNAVPPQSGRDSSFSRCDAAGETEDVHACLVLYTFVNGAKRASPTGLGRHVAGRRQ